MKIAITGGTGFIGNYISRSFLDLGNEVTILAKDVPSNTDSRLNIVYGDVSVLKDVDYFIKKSKPDVVIHLAAQTQANYSVENPYDTFNVNLNGTLNVLESSRLYKNIKAILVASSDKTYGEMSGPEYTEDHALNGIHPYDASKSITDILCKSYSITYDLPVATIRSCNVYGYGDTNSLRIIPGIIKSYKDNTEFSIRNLGKDERDYIHIEDVVSAYHSVLKYVVDNPKFESFNLSSGDRYTTMQIFDIVNSYLDNKVKYRLVDNKNLELPVQRVNSSKLRILTGWSPKHLLVNSIEDIIQKYLSK